MYQDYTSPPAKKQKDKCPQCGWQISRGFNFEQILAGSLPENVNGDFNAFRSTPARTATIEADLLVPIGQVMVTAIVTALPSFALVSWLEWDWKITFVTGSVAILITWIRSLNLHEKTLSVIEEFSYSSSGGSDGPRLRSQDRDAVKLEVVSSKRRSGMQMKIVDLPRGISRHQFAEFCQDILSGKSLARRDWVGSGKQFSRDEYDDLVIAMLEAGLIARVPGKGKSLTVGGRHALQCMISKSEIAPE